MSQVLDREWHGGDRLREWVTERIARHFEDDSTAQALVLGMVLGQQQRLPPPDAVRKFRSAGLIHLLVVSGFNLALVAILALFVIWGYALLVEGQSPVTRATLMATLMIAGTLLDRGYAIWNALAASAFVILIFAPPLWQIPAFSSPFWPSWEYCFCPSH